MYPNFIEYEYWKTISGTCIILEMEIWYGHSDSCYPFSNLNHPRAQHRKRKQAGKTMPLQSLGYPNNSTVHQHLRSTAMAWPNRHSSAMAVARATCAEAAKLSASGLECCSDRLCRCVVESKTTRSQLPGDSHPQPYDLHNRRQGSSLMLPWKNSL